MGFPFTNAQWKELERQAMIYKYMMASLPVPPQLLFPFLTTQSPCNSKTRIFLVSYMLFWAVRVFDLL